MNHFNDLIKNVQECPQPQRINVLIEGIGTVLKQQSGEESPNELWQELEAAKMQLVKAFNQVPGQPPRQGG